MRKTCELFAFSVLILAVALPTFAAERGKNPAADFANSAVADPMPVPVLGQVISSDLELNGLPVPSGSTVLTRSLLRTVNRPAVIHLNNGQVLELGAHSTVYLEKMPDGKIRAQVSAGTLSYLDGAEIKIASGESISFAPKKEPEGTGDFLRGSRSTETGDQAAPGQRMRLETASGRQIIQGSRANREAIRNITRGGEDVADSAGSGSASGAPVQPLSQSSQAENLSQGSQVQTTTAKSVTPAPTVSAQNIAISGFVNSTAAVIIAVREEVPASPANPGPPPPPPPPPPRP